MTQLVINPNTGQYHNQIIGQQARKKSNPEILKNSTFLMKAHASENAQCPREITPERSLSGSQERRYAQKSYRAYNADSSKKRPTSKERQEELYKTELCNYWINGQKCRFGKRCIFAHGQHELRRPKRKIERSKLRPPFRKQVVSHLNKLSDSSFESVSTDLLCAIVEEVRGDEKDSLIFVKAIFNKAIAEPSLHRLYAELWRKLLNVHPMAQVFATQMMDQCTNEYMQPRHKDAGNNTVAWIAQLCSKKVLHAENTVHRILSDMFADEKNEHKIEFWCKLIEALKNTVDTSRYFPQLEIIKSGFGRRVRFMIMDLEDMKKRNWVKRQ